MTKCLAGFATARDLLCVGLAARNFGNGRVALCAQETIILIASSGLQLLWEGYDFLGGFFVCILYNMITIQYNLIL